MDALGDQLDALSASAMAAAATGGGKALVPITPESIMRDGDAGFLQWTYERVVAQMRRVGITRVATVFREIPHGRDFPALQAWFATKNIRLIQRTDGSIGAHYAQHSPAQ